MSALPRVSTETAKAALPAAMRLPTLTIQAAAVQATAALTAATADIAGTDPPM